MPAPPRTEQPDTRHPELDRYASEALVHAFVDDQFEAVRAVQAAAPALARAVEAALPRIQAGGRLLYVGAGTSGRLGLLDSVELYPTFSWPPERAKALLAGGPPALYRAVEGAEDDADMGARDLHSLKPTPQDVVLCIAASGATPYVMGALHAAKAIGSLTLGFANNEGAPVAEQADVGVTLNTGPEVISGSTRLKAGTAQKIALNTFSSSLMVKLHKVYGNLMVDVKATNAKLRRRSVALTVTATGRSEAEATAAVDAADGSVKCAVLMLRHGLDAHSSAQALARVDGSLRKALGE
ncbi:MAG: N-acetylmuramic acid 6-phosphate etherase [Inhella sp.]|uniref:N-acetylmuramic acid 6-phosphate etherase n=1 Tax=Inhella sp. TaxID=1921806 RepID=UPI0022BEF139|nr:N-acetylmuramic acid 6-phosphate etherase [Inhella sp.]MCZ8236096.1 N-acetylmuramic acid 6-phosphate etherase [Inhella sp.]